MSDYLSEEEQYREILNDEEIGRIKDPILRDIRFKYWNLCRQAFLDEYRIPDNMFEKETDKLRAAEKREIEEYRNRKKDEFNNV